jgi:capsular polysaccharide biosynthesis protein
MDLSSLIKQKRQTLFSIFLLFLVVGFLVILVQDFKYGSRSKILVIQEGAGRVDPFAVSRSVEYLSDLFTRVVHSNSFFEDVMNSDYNIDKSYFGDNSVTQMRRWGRTFSARGVDDSGIINMTIYHSDSYQAGQIALAVNHTLITKHQSYHGLGSSVKISVIDQPATSNYPVKPNLLYSLLIIFASSLFFGLIYIYLFPEKKYDINFFASNKKAKQERKIERELKKKEEKEKFVVKGAFVPSKNIVKKKEIKEDDINISGDIDNLFE